MVAVAATSANVKANSQQNAFIHIPSTEREFPLKMPTAKNQKFVYREIPRSLIKEAPYNPNVMVDSAFDALKANIKESGLVDTLIWNEKTGNLCGGHHRLRAIDSLEYPNKNYKIGVAVVQLSEKREKEMNIFLNNAQAQGHFDKDLFFQMLEGEPGIRLDAIGYSLNELKNEFGNDLPPIPQLAELPDFMAAASRKRMEPSKASAGRSQAPDAGGVTFQAATEATTLLITFPSYESKGEFLTARKFPLDTEFIGIRELGLV